MTVHFECRGYWSPLCDVRPGDRLEYSPTQGALCPECGQPVDVLIETLSITPLGVER